MKSKSIILASLLLLAGAQICAAQGNLPKPNGPVNKTKLPNKPPPSIASAKSDLAAGVSAYVDSQMEKMVMDVFITNYGPDAFLSGQRIVTFKVKSKGKTTSYIDGQKINSLKGTATTPSQQAGSSMTITFITSNTADFDDNTVYEVRISPSKSDPNPNNDVAIQVGPNKGKP